MNNKRRHALALARLAAGLVAAGGLTPIGHADEAQIESLVVTAHRIPVAQSRAAGSVTLLDRQAIDRRQTTFATDLLRTLPGVAVNRTAGFGSQTQVRIRGAEANHVLVVIDGVEANDPAGPDEFDFASLTAYDIESIEVLRGPQSALWGSDATAGVINVRTRQASQPVQLGAFAEGGSFGTFRGGARGAWQGDSAGVNISASHYSTDGTKTAASGEERDGAENTTVSLRGNWAPTDITALSVIARYTDGTTQFDDFDFTTGLPADADRESNDKLLLLGTTASVTTLNGRWGHELRATYLESDHARDVDGVPSNTTAAEKLGLYYQSKFDLGANPETHQLVLAVDHEEADFAQRGAASPFGDPNQDQELRNTGFVAEYLGQLGELAVPGRLPSPSSISRAMKPGTVSPRVAAPW